MGWLAERVWQLGIAILLVFVGAALIYVGATERAELGPLGLIGFGLFALALAIPLISKAVTAAQEALDDPARLKAIGDYVQRYRKVFDWLNADGVRWARVRAAATGVKQAYYEQEFEERSSPSILGPISEAAIASQQAVADAFAKAKVIPGAVQVRSLWDNRLTPFLK